MNRVGRAKQEPTTFAKALVNRVGRAKQEPTTFAKALVNRVGPCKARTHNFRESVGEPGGRAKQEPTTFFTRSQRLARSTRSLRKRRTQRLNSFKKQIRAGLHLFLGRNFELAKPFFGCRAAKFLGFGFGKRAHRSGNAAGVGSFWFAVPYVWSYPRFTEQPDFCA